MRADLQRDAQGRCEPQPVREAFERLFEKHGLRGAIRSDNGNAVCGERGAAGALAALGLVAGASLRRKLVGERETRLMKRHKVEPRWHGRSAHILILMDLPDASRRDEGNETSRPAISPKADAATGSRP